MVLSYRSNEFSSMNPRTKAWITGMRWAQLVLRLFHVVAAAGLLVLWILFDKVGNMTAWVMRITVRPSCHWIRSSMAKSLILSTKIVRSCHSPRMLCCLSPGAQRRWPYSGLLGGLFCFCCSHRPCDAGHLCFWGFYCAPELSNLDHTPQR